MSKDVEIAAVAAEIKTARDGLAVLIALPRGLRDMKAIVAVKSQIMVLERKRAALLAPPPPAQDEDEDEEGDEDDEDDEDEDEDEDDDEA